MSLFHYPTEHAPVVPFSLEFIDNCTLGGHSNGAIEIENLLGRPTTDSSQADVYHCLTPTGVNASVVHSR